MTGFHHHHGCWCPGAKSSAITMMTWLWPQCQKYHIRQHVYIYMYLHPASIATLVQRRHWSASSRSAADVAPTLVFRRLCCYGMSAFCRSATVGISLFADVLCLDIGGWKSSVSRINVVVQPDYRYINYIFWHHDPKNYCTSNLNKM